MLKARDVAFFEQHEPPKSLAGVMFARGRITGFNEGCELARDRIATLERELADARRQIRKSLEQAQDWRSAAHVARKALRHVVHLIRFSSKRNRAEVALATLRDADFWFLGARNKHG